MPLTIQTAQLSDIDAINRVYYETWVTTYPNEEYGITLKEISTIVQKELDTDTREMRAQHITNMTPDMCFFVAKLDGEVVGVCGGFKDAEKNQMKSIYVLPAYQGKGIGNALWLTFYEWSDKSKKTIVHVATYNQQAISFYAKIGFIDTGKRFTEERFKFPNGGYIPEMELVLK